MAASIRPWSPVKYKSCQALVDMTLRLAAPTPAGDTVSYDCGG